MIWQSLNIRQASRRVLTVTAVALTTLALGSASLPLAQAQTVAETPGNATLTVWSNRPAHAVHPGGTVTMTAMVATAGCGPVSLSAPVPVVGKRVIDLWQRVPGGSWTRIATASYGDGGLQGASFTARPTRPVTYYQAHYRGVATREFPSASPIVTVKVVPRVRGWGGMVGGNLPVGARYPLMVSILPAPSYVLLQRRTQTGWMSVARLRPIAGSLKVNVPVVSGTRDWRLWLPATRLTAASPSRTLTTVFGRLASGASLAAVAPSATTTGSASATASTGAEPLTMPTSATWLSTVAEHAGQADICSGRAVRGQWVVRTRWLIHGGAFRDVLAGVDVHGENYLYTDNDYRSMRFDPALYGCMPTLWMRVAPIGSQQQGSDRFFTDMGAASALYWTTCPTA